MSYLLDTNTCIYYLNDRDSSVVTRILETDPEMLAISALTLAELHFGAANSAKPEANSRRVHTFVKELETLPFDGECAVQFGRLKANLKARGLSIPDFDVAIAATAIVHGRTLVSNDRHFQWIPSLTLENWTL